MILKTTLSHPLDPNLEHLLPNTCPDPMVQANKLNNGPGWDKPFSPPGSRKGVWSCLEVHANTEIIPGELQGPPTACGERQTVQKFMHSTFFNGPDLFLCQTIINGKNTYVPCSDINQAPILDDGYHSPGSTNVVGLSGTSIQTAQFKEHGNNPDRVHWKDSPSDSDTKCLFFQRSARQLKTHTSTRVFHAEVTGVNSCGCDWTLVMTQTYNQQCQRTGQTVDTVSQSCY
jgi:hypothetical protein